MNLGVLIPVALIAWKLAQDIEPSKPIARKIAISIGKTPLILPEGFELVGPSRLGLRPKGL
jgi:hypothetical protein